MGVNGVPCTGKSFDDTMIMVTDATLPVTLQFEIKPRSMCRSWKEMIRVKKKLSQIFKYLKQRDGILKSDNRGQGFMFEDSINGLINHIVDVEPTFVLNPTFRLLLYVREFLLYFKQFPGTSKKMRGGVDDIGGAIAAIFFGGICFGACICCVVALALLEIPGCPVWLAWLIGALVYVGWLYICCKTVGENY